MEAIRTQIAKHSESGRNWRNGFDMTRGDAISSLENGGLIRMNNFYAERVCGEFTQWSFMVFHSDGDAWWFKSAADAVEVLGEMNWFADGPFLGD